MIIYILAAIGLICIIIGGWAIYYLKKFAKTEYATSSWKNFRIFILIFAILIGLLSWPGTYFMGYPFEVEKEIWRVVGIPFVVAFFDSEGRDYVGPLTMLGIVMNGLFWFLFPHNLLALYSLRLKKKLNA
jgi:hypothetical protein